MGFCNDCPPDPDGTGKFREQGAHIPGAATPGHLGTTSSLTTHAWGLLGGWAALRNASGLLLRLNLKGGILQDEFPRRTD